MADKDTKKVYNLKEKGFSGTIVNEGIITDPETNPDLKGLKWLKTVDRMRRTDAAVRISLQALFLPILSAHWYVEPASEETEDIDIANEIEENLMGGMTITWRDFLRQALLSLPFGVYPFEIVYTEDENRNVRWKKFAPRLPQTILKWETEDGENGITQQLTNGDKASIPIEKMIIFCNEKEGDNWWGMSILRSAYPHYYYKQAYYKIDAIAHEKHGLGMPIVTLPPNATADDEKKAEKIMKNIRVHHQAYMKKTAGWLIEMLDMKANSIKNPLPSIQHHNRMILLNVLAQFLEIGSASSSGSYAASNDQTDLFMLSLESIASSIAESINNYAVKRLVDINHTVTKYPQLKFNKIKRIDFLKLADSLNKLSTAQLLTPNAKTEDWIRDQYDMPEIEEEERAEEELMDFLNEMEDKKEPLALPAQAGQPLVKQTPQQLTAFEFADDTKDKGDNSEYADKMQEDIQKKQNKKGELQQLIYEKKLWLLEQQKNGNKITPQKAAKIKIEIMELQKKLDKKELKDNKLSISPDNNQPDKEGQSKPTDKSKAAGEMKRRVDNVLTAIEKQYKL